MRERVSPARGKPAVPPALALEAVRATTGVDLSKSRARAGFSRGHLIDVVLSLPGGVGSAHEHSAAQALMGSLLGDARASDWLGALSVEPAPKGGPLRVLDSRAPPDRFFPLVELPEAFERAITGLYASLPEGPLWSLGGEELWTLFEVSAEPADDYPEKDDLLLATTYLPEMLKCHLAGSRFASSRFSRHGELFSYLKIERGSDDPRVSLSARRVLEDALDAALVSERSGRVVGSGLGIRYAYVDFALFDVDTALDAVSEVARRVGLPERSWMLFCDTELSDEWAPIHPKAPSPPRVALGQ
jgi:hypothetical protein